MSNMEWNLDRLYKSYDDEKYINDKNELALCIKKELELADKLSNDTLEEYLKNEEKMHIISSLLFSYASLKTTTDVNDMKSAAECAALQMMLQDTVAASVKLQKFLSNKDINELVSGNPFLEQYKYNLECIKEEASHMLSEKEEMLYAKLTMVASDGWSEIQSKLTSNMSIRVKGMKDKMPLSAVRGLAYDNDPVVRKNAYMAEIKAYDSIKDAVAMGLNNIKRESNIMASLRGYPDILSVSLAQSHMSKDTLNAMIEAIKDELPSFRRYFKLKAKALGYKNGLPFYELFAPMGKLTRTYTFDEAKNMVLDVYKSFSDRLYNLGLRAFSEDWIDVLPHDGKVGGAFCAEVLALGESRVLTNFTGSLTDISTLAHELGHAYHNEVCYSNAPLNQSYPMQLAETASIMCETLMAKKLIRETINKNELLTIVENSLQGDTQCVVDILSRFLFEGMVCDTPVENPLSASDMCEFMLKAQDLSYGDGLDPKYRHPYMWLCKPHYYSAGFNFYNWPYAFGLLYAKGLYAKYIENKEEFVKNYDQMLKNTSIMKAEEVAKCMNIDITKKEFWLASLKTIEEDIDLFEELLK